LGYKNIRKVVAIIHKSVLLNEAVEYLNLRSGGLYVDGTLGGGGHSLEICKQMGPKGRLIAIDQDERAIEAATEVLKDFQASVTVVHDNFSNIKKIFNELNIDRADGFLLDLGVSSFQLDEGIRGFSYMQDAPLDMRMDRQSDFSAYQVVNEYPFDRLHHLIRDYGEERWAKRIAEFIVKERDTDPIQTTLQLVGVIKRAVPKGAREDGPHPAKRTFQAIRIEVNRELAILEKTIEDMTELLVPGGRLCIITFHSLEDRIVKNTFRRLADPCTCPIDFPLCVCGKKPMVRVITKKPVLPGVEELENNHRARSAKLRVQERI